MKKNPFWLSYFFIFFSSSKNMELMMPSSSTESLPASESSESIGSIKLSSVKDFETYCQNFKLEKGKQQYTRSRTLKIKHTKKEKNVEIDNKLMGKLAQICLFKNEQIIPPQTLIDRILGTSTNMTEIINDIKEKHPDYYDALKHYIVTQGLKYDGNVLKKIKKHKKKSSNKKLKVEVTDTGYSPGDLIKQFINVMRGKKDARIKLDAVVGGIITISGLVGTFLGFYFAFTGNEECECPTALPTAPTM